MQSVTSVTKQFKQPRSGFINPKDFEALQFNDSNSIQEDNQIHQQIVGMTVDYLTRYLIGQDKREAFKIQLLGAEIAASRGLECAYMADEYLDRIDGINAEQVIAACKLSTFDIWFRNCSQAMYCSSADETEPSDIAIKNIITLVNRSIQFIDNYGPIKQYGFDFQPNGYTRKITSGDGDFLTDDTLLDFKVSKNKLTNKQSLQLAVYWMMGQLQGNPIFKGIKYIATFNPLLNQYCKFDMTKLQADIIAQIATDVIGYEVHGNKIVNNKIIES